ncbi:MAG TPA: acyl-ACP--UDP-N-acetylglucosamine O-acyltransferase [Symbiobacteriaceae bacterium]|nr:acyl-ACP--UDP-N-acetylglucosamine O-acyltransferase [Symbiobacteriaceae bacterium]
MSTVIRPAATIAPTAFVAPTARIGLNVEIGPNVIIEDGVIIGDNCWIGANSVIHAGTLMGSGNRVSFGAIIGQEPQDLKYDGEESGVTIGDNNRIREYVTISRGTAGGGGVTRVGHNNLFMTGVHIGHDSQLGSHIIIANACAVAGHVVIEDGAVIGGLSGLHQFTRVGCQAMVGAMSYLTNDVPPFVLAEGKPARARGVNIVGLRRSGMTAGDRLEIQRAFRVLYRMGLNRGQAIERLLDGGAPGLELAHLIQFVQRSERGICRGVKEAAQ